MKISPSIMCADLLNLGRDLKEIERAGADTVHVDIMDGHFVPGFTFGTAAVERMRAMTRLPVEVHLMSDRPELHMHEFLELGISELCVHAEASADLYRCMSIIKSAGVRAGVAVNPGTAIGQLEQFFGFADTFLVMAVCPGFIGQKQIGSCIDKAERLVRELCRRGCHAAEVVIDGGVKIENVGAAAAAGVSRVVSGTGIFECADGIASAIARMREQAEPSLVRKAS